MSRFASSLRYCRVILLLPLVPLIWSSASEAQPAQAVCDEIYSQYKLVAEGCPARVPGGTGAENGLATGVGESHIFFPAGGSRLDAAAQAQITQLSEVLKVSVMRQACLRLVGHSDSVGGAAANEALSLQRAVQVADMLKAQLDDPMRVQEVLGVGETRPLSGFATTAVENRRVEIWAKTCVR